VKDQVRVLNQLKREITKIVRNYGDFLHLIEEMEENSSKPNPKQKVLILKRRAKVKRLRRKC
jgi:hypothetical protein